MAMARISVCPATVGEGTGPWWIHIPTADGTLDPEPYDRARMTGRITPVGEHALDGPGDLDAHLARLIPANGPITIMIHGFQYAPEAPPATPATRSANPHSQIYHFVEPDSEPGGEIERDSHATPWPKRLGFEDDSGETGLAVAFGWSSHPAYRHGTWRDWLSSVSWRQRGATTYYARAYRRATNAGLALAILIARLHAVAPGRPLSIYAHSLGTRVALKAVELLAERRHPALGAMERIVLIAGAEHRGHARAVLNAINQARIGRPHVYNLMTTRDSVLEYWGRRFAAFVRREEFGPLTFWDRITRVLVGGTVIGRHGKPLFVRYSRWVDLCMDAPEVAEALDLPEPGGRVDHWTLFTHPPFIAFAARLIRSDRPMRRLNRLFHHHPLAEDSGRSRRILPVS
ncbi:MAG: hypothetical protein VYB54_16610 [Pseudomonadota bacterium]|nr:hypothetical protein [Pseudomonadota bacterium]